MLKFVIKSDILIEAIKACISILPKKNTKDEDQYLKLSFFGGHSDEVELIGQNGQDQVECVVRVEAIKEHSPTIFYVDKNIIDVLKPLKGQLLSCTVRHDVISIGHDEGNESVPVFRTASIEEAQVKPAGMDHTIQEAFLPPNVTSYFKALLPLAVYNSLRPELHGIHICVQDKKLFMVASDAFQLRFDELELKQHTENFAFTIPARVVPVINTFIEKSLEYFTPVKITNVGKENTLLSIDLKRTSSLCVTLHTVDMNSIKQYPDFLEFVAKHNTTGTGTEFNAEQLFQGVSKGEAVVEPKTTNGILHIEPGQCKLVIHNPWSMTTYERILTQASYSGAPFVFPFRLKNLVEMFKKESGTWKMFADSESKVAFFKQRSCTMAVAKVELEAA